MGLQQIWLVGLLLCAFVGLVVPQPAVVPLSFDVGTGTYGTFIDTVRAALANHPNPDNVQGHPVLPKQRFGQPPARLLHVQLSAGDKSTTTLAVRDDNVYLIGFRAQSGNWYELGYTGKDQQALIPGATLLECGGQYWDLVGGETSKAVKANLRQLDLGKSAADAAVRKLAAYAHAGAPDEATKLALARLMIIVSEAARMGSISATVNSGWGGTSMLSEEQPPYLHNWGDLSAAILGWRQMGRHYKWPRKMAGETGIKNAADALAVVQLLLNR